MSIVSEVSGGRLGFAGPHRSGGPRCSGVPCESGWLQGTISIMGLVGCEV